MALKRYVADKFARADADAQPTGVLAGATEYIYDTGKVNIYDGSAWSEIDYARTGHTHVASDISDFRENVEDDVANLITGGTDISVTYTDNAGSAGTLTIDFTGSTGKTTEEVQDDAWGISFNTTLITVNYDDANNEVDFTVNDDLSQYDNTSSGFISDITSENFADLSDVSITSIASGEIIKYDGSNYVNNTLAEAGIAASGHTHSSSDISDFDESVDDRVDTLTTAGTGLNKNYDDGGNELTFSVAQNGITTTEIDESISPTWSSSHTFNSGADMGSSRITSVADPTNAQDAATKNYVDSIEQGLDLKDSVRVASTSSIDLTSTTDPNPIDGVTLSDGDRILLKDQSTASENGIYVAQTATDPTTWTRASDADADSEVTAGMYTFISEGTSWGDYSFVLTTNDPITVGTTSLNFTVFTNAGQLSAGDGLTKSGSTFNVRLDIDEDGSNVASAYGLNFTTNVDVTDDTDNTVTVSVPAGGGSNEIQYNNGSNGFTASSDFTYNNTSKVQTLQGYHKIKESSAGIPSAAHDEGVYFAETETVGNDTITRHKLKRGDGSEVIINSYIQ